MYKLFLSFFSLLFFIGIDPAFSIEKESNEPNKSYLDCFGGETDKFCTDLINFLDVDSQLKTRSIADKSRALFLFFNSYDQLKVCQTENSIYCKIFSIKTDLQKNNRSDLGAEEKKVRADILFFKENKCKLISDPLTKSFCLKQITSECKNNNFCLQLWNLKYNLDNSDASKEKVSLIAKNKFSINEGFEKKSAGQVKKLNANFSSTDEGKEFSLGGPFEKLQIFNLFKDIRQNSVLYKLQPWKRATGISAYSYKAKTANGLAIEKFELLVSREQKLYVIENKEQNATTVFHFDLGQNLNGLAITDASYVDSKNKSDKLIVQAFPNELLLLTKDANNFYNITSQQSPNNTRSHFYYQSNDNNLIVFPGWTLPGSAQNNKNNDYSLEHLNNDFQWSKINTSTSPSLGIFVNTALAKSNVEKLNYIINKDFLSGPFSNNPLLESFLPLPYFNHSTAVALYNNSLIVFHSGASFPANKTSTKIKRKPVNCSDYKNKDRAACEISSHISTISFVPQVCEVYAPSLQQICKTQSGLQNSFEFFDNKRDWQPVITGRIGKQKKNNLGKLIQNLGQIWHISPLSFKNGNAGFLFIVDVAGSAYKKIYFLDANKESLIEITKNLDDSKMPIEVNFALFPLNLKNELGLAYQTDSGFIILKITTKDDFIWPDQLQQGFMSRTFLN